MNFMFMLHGNTLHWQSVNYFANNVNYFVHCKNLYRDIYELERFHLQFLCLDSERQCNTTLMQKELYGSVTWEVKLQWWFCLIAFVNIAIVYGDVNRIHIWWDLILESDLKLVNNPLKFV
jgi:hypothetical protein